ncbi:SARP family transcriptional regulator [Asanoa ishikariensis]|uniref:DNA-binding transcriptional activator of the SARP family n=1 Tax=Asanoa ishikariensis TaxID=137265 RepID=A0A1H3UJ33_9ACTN|nr:BTAD domain-containing putative transcriptional regulator [Asanoa ishikariensis]GIF63391.1 SARP family transcriptional regulator [Asanoa ishikariensis]SDZ62378.1 DNA-binding transcriptional activator of the SARP family [Asanoa ishikariensis]
MSPWVRVLGPVTVDGPAGPAALVGARQRTLLALLALGVGTVVPRSRLVDALWGEDPPRTAVRTLHSHVSRVRQALESCGLPGVLLTKEPGYQLELPRAEVDAHRFEDGVRAARACLPDEPEQAAALLTESLAWWRGDALADGEPDGWGRAETERLAEIRLTAIEDLWDANLRLGRHPEAVPELERLATIHPTRERLVELLMRALFHCGRHVDALDRYRRLSNHLAAEFGVDPSHRVNDLHAAILRGELGRNTPTAAGLPPRVGHFAGRTVELDALRHWLAGGTTQIMVVRGSAGIGKTALAVEWAHEVSAHFPDGIVFVDLRGHDPETALTPGEVIARVLDGLGVPPDRLPVSVEQRVAHYRALIHDRKALIVLDNAGTADHVLPLVPNSPHSRILVTSRHRLAAASAYHSVLHVELDALGPGDARALLGRVLGSERVAAEPAATDRLVELCGRIPIALRVAGARLAGRPRQPIAELVAELDQGGLDALSVDGDARSVRTVFASAYQALSDPAARMFRLVGLHPGGTVSSWLAAAIVDDTHGRGRRGVDELAAAHLLNEVAVGRYRFHDLMRRYAVECAADDSESEAAVGRLLDWYLAVAEAANRVLDRGRDRVVATPLHPPRELPFGADPDEVLAFLDGERDNLVPVAAFALRRGHDRVVWQLSYLFSGYFESRGHSDSRVAINRLGLAAAQRAGDPVVEGLMRSGLGVAHIAARQYEAALDHLREALRLMAAAGDLRGIGHAYNNLAAALGELGRFEEAIGACHEAHTVHVANSHTLGAILALNNLGHLYARVGQPDESLHHLHRGLLLARDADDRRLEAAIQHGIGETHRATGALEAALEAFTAALALRRAAGNRRYEARTLVELGATLIDAGREAEAGKPLDEAAAIADDLSDEHTADRARAQLHRLSL